MISWINGWRAQSSGTLNGRIQSGGLSIAFLNAFSSKAVQGIDGEIALDVRLHGTLERPAAEGFVRLENGKLAPSALGIQVTNVTLDGLLEPRGFRIRQLSARSGSGQLSGSGIVALNNFSPQNIDLTITAKNWPAINTQQYRALTNGSININETLKAPRLSGKLDVVSGEVHPDLAFLDHGSTPAKRDPTITVVSANNEASSQEHNGKTDAEAANDSALRNLNMHIQVTIPNNFWVKHRNANLELSGNLQIAQMPGGKPSIAGVIETIRGWVGFQGRRFTVTRGKVDFTGGGKINPTLDVIAEYRVTNYVVNAIVNGTVDKPALKLASEPQLDQADILALLLFNKPTSALGKNEQVSLQQDAIGLTSGFAASAVGTAVSKALGLQDLGVDFSDVDFSGGQVRYSRYLSRNTFVTVGQDVTGKTGQEASAEYQITPDWKLDVTTNTKGSRGVDLIWHKRY
jgi:translocation and assembly module TamB